jgi:hypothetical protein
MTPQIPLEFATCVDWRPLAIMGNTMPPRDPDEEDEEQDEDDDSTDEPPVVHEPDED